ncbi:MAG: hypothetical protein WDW38_002083 [Sanguina aurantia]
MQWAAVRVSGTTASVGQGETRRGGVRSSDSWEEDGNRPLDPESSERSTWHGQVPALVRSGSMVINRADPSQTYLLNSPLQQGHTAARTPSARTMAGLMSAHVQSREGSRGGNVGGSGSAGGMEHGNITPPDLIDFSVEPRASCTPPAPVSSAAASAGDATPRDSHGSGSKPATEPWSATFSPMMRGATSAAATAQARQCAASAPDLMSFGSPAASDPAMRDLPRDPLPDVLHPTKW